MFKFHLFRSSRDIFGHIILILLPILLIAFFNYVYSSEFFDLGPTLDMSQLLTVLTIGFALLFQIYGSGLSFETLGSDFLTPMHDRILATPVNPRKIVLSVMFTGTLVSFLQTLAVVLFSMIVLHARFDHIILVLLVLLISVIFNQLLGTVILFSTKKVSTANIITTLYGIIAPFTVGLYYPLPDNPLLNFMKDYGTPMGLAQKAIFGVINQNLLNVLLGLVPLLVMIMILFILIKPLSKKVIS